VRVVCIGLLLLSATSLAFGQGASTRSFSSLLRDGYEIKGAGVPPGQMLFLQKGSSAYVCLFSPRNYDSSSQAAVTMGVGICAPIQ